MIFGDRISRRHILRRYPDLETAKRDLAQATLRAYDRFGIGEP